MRFLCSFLGKCNFLTNHCTFWSIENRGAGLVPTSASNSKPKVSPYSVIDIAPIQQQLLSEQSDPPSSPPANESERDIQDVPSSPGLSSGYSVPVPCGYATPSNVPVIPPTYTTPVIIRHFSMDEDGKKRDYSHLVGVGFTIHNLSLFTFLLVSCSLSLLFLKFCHEEVGDKFSCGFGCDEVSCFL